MARSLLIALKYLQSPQRYASLATRLLFTVRATSIHRFRSPTRDVCLFGKHAAPVTRTPVANGPSPTAFMSHLFPPACFFHLLPSHQQIQEVRSFECARKCVRGVGVHGAYWVVVRTTVLDIEMLFLFIQRPAVTVVSGASSLTSVLRVHLENCQIHKPSQLCRML